MSWRRSAALGVRKDRLTPHYETELDTDSRFVQVARPVFRRAGDELAGTPVGLVLADGSANVVERVTGDRTARALLDHIRLSRGHRWSERDAGTNAIGTALEQAAPTVVHGREHFVDPLARLTGAAATITDPRTNRVLGVVGLSCAVGDASALMLPYARRIGLEIEGVLLDDSLAAERALLEHFVKSRRRQRGAVVSVNSRHMLTNATAARYVQDVDHALFWEHAQRVIADGRLGSEDLELAGGAHVTASFEPVTFGTTTVGALVRLELRPAVAALASRRATKPGVRSNVGWASLSPSQFGIAELVAAGLTNQEAAARLCVSPHTVDSHMRQIFNKLGIRSRVNLARIVFEHREDYEGAAS